MCNEHWDIIETICDDDYKTRSPLIIKGKSKSSEIFCQKCTTRTKITLINDFSLNFSNIQLFYDKYFPLFIVHELIYKNNSTLNYKWCLTFTRLVLVIFPHSSRNIKTKIYFEQHLLFYITVFHHTKIFHWNHILEKNNFW